MMYLAAEPATRPDSLVQIWVVAALASYGYFVHMSQARELKKNKRKMEGDRPAVRG